MPHRREWGEKNEFWGYNTDFSVLTSLSGKEQERKKEMLEHKRKAIGSLVWEHKAEQTTSDWFQRLLTGVRLTDNSKQTEGNNEKMSNNVKNNNATW